MSAAERKFRRAYAAFRSAFAESSRLSADYTARPSNARWARAAKATERLDRARVRLSAARRELENAAPRAYAVPSGATVAPRIERVGRDVGTAVAAIAAGIVAALAPAIGFLSSVVSAEVIAAGLR